VRSAQCGFFADVNRRNRDETGGEVGSKRTAGKRIEASIHEAFAMRKVFLSVVVLMVGGFMLHGAVACELNRQTSTSAQGL
jgi:hypothetical protein